MNRLLTNKWLRHAPYIIQINDPYNRSSLHKHMVQEQKKNFVQINSLPHFPAHPFSSYTYSGKQNLPALTRSYHIFVRISMVWNHIRKTKAQNDILDEEEETQMNKTKSHHPGVIQAQ